MTKTKNKNKLDAEADLRLKLPAIVPDLKCMCPSW